MRVTDLLFAFPHAASFLANIPLCKFREFSNFPGKTFIKSNVRKVLAVTAITGPSTVDET